MRVTCVRTIGWVLFAALLIAPVGCGEKKVPEELYRVWRTDLPAYRDRYLDIRRDTVVFGTGGASSVAHRIERAEAEERRDGGILCVLHYLTRDGGEAQLRLVYTPGPPEQLRFENRKEAWVPEEDAAWLARKD